MTSETNDLESFETYNDYLNSFVSPKDLYYLVRPDVARKVAQLSYGNPGQVLSEAEFWRLKDPKSKQHQNEKDLKEKSVGEITEPLLAELAERDVLCRDGKLKTIVYIKMLNKREEEIQGVIDFNQRLKDEDFSAYFQGRRKLVPLKTDLYFKNFVTGFSYNNNSDHFDVCFNLDDLIISIPRC